MIREWLFRKLIKGYSIFFIHEDKAYYVNDITINPELKEVVLSYEKRDLE